VVISPLPPLMKARVIRAAKCLNMSQFCTRFSYLRPCLEKGNDFRVGGRLHSRRHTVMRQLRSRHRCCLAGSVSGGHTRAMAQRARGSAVRRFAIRPAALPCSVRPIVRGALPRALPLGQRTSGAATIHSTTVLCTLPSLCGYLDWGSAHWDHCSPPPCFLFFDSQCTAGKLCLTAVSYSCVFSWLTFFSSSWFGVLHRRHGGCSCRC